MYCFFGLLFVLMFIINSVYSNVLVWWMVFLVSVVCFVWMCKFSGSSVSMINYFMVQEMMSLLFLFFSSSILQFLCLLVKGGVSPLHFWIFSVGLDLSGLMLMWFLVVQKLPFVPVYGEVYFLGMESLLLFGILLCHFQYLLLSSDKLVLMVSSTESFGWLLVILFWSYYGFFFLVGMYFSFMVLLFGSVLKSNFVFSMGWEAIIIFMNFPLGLVFLLKYLVVSVVSFHGFLYVLLFFSVVLSYVGLMFWLMSVVLMDLGWWSSKLLVCYGFYFSVMLFIWVFIMILMWLVTIQ